uniref:trinucleotide repeat-containing gene 6A protein-like n=1 Tax=Oncorhynchus gorbuscha TaxID=8017 RepID=UPI001EAF3A5E|nr:trinucleotide repeat-containing gene 6A protein-like [Oncorhynchus gorbuscha]XP_046193502.1 trinucleotide repeat-containing gene 6A protein-like [Oncorhynchus gorbuscha]XP_046193503.1 trinucleotide repeat-containing gene 6A protein-like [Oncorhynchus gorbuscha]
MAPIRDSASHSPNQTDLDHPGLDSQYENCPWSSGSPCSRDSNWDTVLVDSVGSDTPSSSSSSSAAGNDPELTLECLDTDSASSSGGSERNLVTAMTSSSPPPPGGRNGNHFSPLTNGGVPPGSSNNIITCNGAANGPRGCVANGSVANVGPNDASAPADGSHGNKPSPWASANGAGLTPGTLNPKVNHGAWPGPQGPSGCRIVQQGGSLAWGGTQADSLSLSEQPQRLLLNDTTVKTRHLNTTNGPNNTTNAIDTSSLPNSTGGSVHRNESGSGLRSWAAGGGGGGAGSELGNQLSNGTLSGAQHPHSEGLAGGFSKPWGGLGPWRHCKRPGTRPALPCCCCCLQQ